VLSRILARNSLGIRFWGLYAIVYDTLLSLAPYNAMLAEVVAKVGLPRGSAVLDAGCGSGNLTRLLVEAGYQVEAIDSSKGMLERASSKCCGASCRLADLNGSLPFADQTFDAVTCSNVLYSLPDPERALVELERVLKPGGRLILTTPMPHFSMGKILSRHWEEKGSWGRARLLSRIPSLFLLAGFNVLILSPEQKKKFHFFTPEQLELLLVKAGYHDVEIRSTYAEQGLLAWASRLSAVTLPPPLTANLDVAAGHPPDFNPPLEHS
jgi:ubiquinone/menaquinone biosynthesis C-methylase UbiE